MIHWHCHRTGEAGAQAVVWLHGFLGSGADFTGLATTLPGFNHIAPDLPGHGATRATRFTDHAMPAMADALLDWLARQGITRPHLVGYSMGGRLALYLATTARQHFARILAVSASPGLDASAAAARRSADRALAKRLLIEPLPAFLEGWYAQPLFATLDPDEPEITAMHQRRLRQNPLGLARSLRAMGTGAMPNLWPELGMLDAPVEVVVGDLDEKFTTIAQRMAVSGRVKVHPIAGAGHAPHLERPALFAETLYSVLQGNEE